MLQNNLDLLRTCIRSHFAQDEYLTKFIDAPYIFSALSLGRDAPLEMFDCDEFCMPEGILLIEDDMSLMGFLDTHPGQKGLYCNRLYLECMQVDDRFLITLGQIRNVWVVAEQLFSEFEFGAAVRFKIGKKISVVDIANDLPQKYIDRFCFNAVAGYKEIMSVKQLIKRRNPVGG